MSMVVEGLYEVLAREQLARVGRHDLATAAEPEPRPDRRGPLSPETRVSPGAQRPDASVGQPEIRLPHSLGNVRQARSGADSINSG
jgi:hypothetical protein